MKLLTLTNPLGMGFTVIDQDEYDGATDSTLHGEGKTADAARQDFFEKWTERQMQRDMKNAVSAAQSWDSMIRDLFGART